MFDSHPRLSFIWFQFYSFSDFRIAIPNFDFQIFGTFRIHVSILHLSICLFSFSEIWFPISGFRFTSVSSICLFSFSEIWFPISGVRLAYTFTKRVSFCVFPTFRFHIYSFLIFDVHFSNFRCPQRNARRGALLPKKTNGTSSNEPKTFGTYFKRYCTRHVAHVPWVPNLFSL